MKSTTLDYDYASRFVKKFVACFLAVDIDTLKSLLDDNIIAFITNAEGGVDEVAGSENYIQRIEAMDIPSSGLKLNITQVLPIENDKILFMVEVKAGRGNDSVHNFTGQLIKLSNNKIVNYWMVEALPKQSDQFWLDPQSS